MVWTVERCGGSCQGKADSRVVGIIRDEATCREDNLPTIYHYSEARVAHIVERVKDAREQAKTGGGYAGAVDEATYRGGQQTLPFEESRTPEGPVRPTGAQTLRPFRTPQNTYTFKVEGRAGVAEQEVKLAAPDMKAAWKKLDRQGGYLRAEMTKETVPEIIGPP
jgi:hypothetical protein